MRITLVFVLMLCAAALADNLEKTQKKQLESQVKTMTGEAQKLEKAGRLAEARIKYAGSQALIEVKDVTDALKGLIKLKLAKQDLYLAPIYLPSYTPIEGPQARRFANNDTRLFVRYPGLEDSKLGTEGMSGGEKFAMGYKIATASVDIAM